jgi:uncharacterized membrane protein
LNGCDDLRVSTHVLETFLGVPLHPLLIHTAVVFVPLLIIAALVYALVPELRGRVGWLLVGLAVLAPLCALASKLSGDAFRARMVRRHLTSPQGLALIDGHRHLGTILVYVVAGLGVVSLLLVLLPAARQNKAVSLALVVLAVGLSVASGYYVFRTGDTGAHIAWSGY